METYQNLTNTDEKHTLLEYLSQVKKIEMEKFSLLQADENIVGIKGGITEAANNKMRSIKQKIDAAVADEKKASDSYEFSKKYPDTGSAIKNLFFDILFLFLIGICGGGALGYYLPSLIGAPRGVQIVFAVILAVVGFVVGIFLEIFFFCCPLDYRSKSKRQLDDARSLEEKAAKVVACKETREKAEEEYLTEEEKLKKDCLFLDQQANINWQNVTKFDELLQKYYDLNILPPDYRTMDCVITLDHIFRNDLADTVREAILLYEEWVFRGVVIKGMDNIMKMLGNLSSQMQYMQQTLDSIDAGVFSMCIDLQEALVLQQQQNRTQEQLLYETQCSRQAAEAIQRSNERFEWYAEQHRAGLL